MVPIQPPDSQPLRHQVATQVVARAKRAKITCWSEVEALSDEELDARMYPAPIVSGEARPEPNPATIHFELRRTGVTLRLLHEEYLKPICSPSRPAGGHSRPTSLSLSHWSVIVTGSMASSGPGPHVIDAILRRLARDQWVRLHGTPRVTVLVGGEVARRLWNEWTALAGVEGVLFEGPLEPAIRDAAARAIANPSATIAVLATKDTLATWRTNRTDRLAALVDEGLLVVSSGGLPPHATLELDARSAAEAALFEALEATPATTGRFELNGRLSVRFGPTAAEVDILSRRDRIAIEIDGYHHFTDPDCYRRDRQKDLLLQTQGLLVIRLLAEDVMRDPRDGVSVVCRGLAYRLGRSEG